MADRKETTARTFRLSLLEVRDRAQNALLLAGAATFLSYPMIYYQFNHMMGKVFARPPSPEQLKLLSVGQSLILFAIAFLCSLVGFLYFERLTLPGFGRFRDLKKWLPVSLGLGIALTPLAYFAADRGLLAQIPETYPHPWPWAVAWIVGNALSQEVVARFGLLSIGVYLLRWVGFQGRPWPAITVVSGFGVLCSFLFLERMDFAARIGPWPMAFSLLAIFISQWALSEVYVRKGFMAALALHIGLGVRVVIYALMG